MSKGALSAGTALLIALALPIVGAAWWWTRTVASAPTGGALGVPPCQGAPCGQLASTSTAAPRPDASGR